MLSSVDIQQIIKDNRFIVCNDKYVFRKFIIAL